MGLWRTCGRGVSGCTVQVVSLSSPPELGVVGPRGQGNRLGWCVVDASGKLVGWLVGGVVFPRPRASQTCPAVKEQVQAGN